MHMKLEKTRGVLHLESLICYRLFAACLRLNVNVTMIHHVPCSMMMKERATDFFSAAKLLEKNVLVWVLCCTLSAVSVYTFLYHVFAQLFFEILRTVLENISYIYLYFPFFLD